MTIVAIFGLAACSPTLAPIVATPERPAPFPECQADEYAFAGETTLAALGMAETVGGPDANRVGMVWVTAGPVDAEAFGPGGGPGFQPPPAQRAVCVEWPDGSGMMTLVEDDWQPPGPLTGVGAGEASAAEPPLGLIGALVAVLVLIGVSYLAFRREGSTAA